MLTRSCCQLRTEMGMDEVARRHQLAIGRWDDLQRFTFENKRLETSQKPFESGIVVAEALELQAGREVGREGTWRKWFRVFLGGKCRLIVKRGIFFTSLSFIIFKTTLSRLPKVFQLETGKFEFQSVVL